MSYISTAFILFLIPTLLIYHLIPSRWKEKYHVGGYVLLAASLFFYSCFDLRYILFLLFTAVSTYLCALFLPRTEKKKLIFILCIAVNAAVWFVIKLLPWTVDMSISLLESMGIPVSARAWKLLVPVGISYYTLQAIAYLVDVYKQKIQPEKNPLHYLLFLSWFPAVVQGPISRYNQLMPQLLNHEKFSFENLRRGLLLMVFGLIKKVVVADRVGIFVNACFAGYSEMTGIVLYLGAVGYALQLYADFSGCVDICRGMSRLFGIELVHNFRRPYQARSIKEFWGRWHISLSNWLKDHVYIPLGGNRKGTLRKYLNLLLTFLVSGIWHGAGYQFYLWGILHAVYQIVGQATETHRKKLRSLLGVEEGSLSQTIIQTVITFHLVTFAWIFFRAPSVTDAFLYIGNMFGRPDLYMLFDGMFQLGVSQGHFFVLLLHLIAFFLIGYLTKDQESATEGILRLHVSLRWVVYLVLVFDVILLGAYGGGYDMSGFMYGGF